MDHDTHPTVIDRYWQAIRDHDPGLVTDLLTDDVIEDWPQSGERVRGAEAWGRIVLHPTDPDVSIRRIFGAGEVWVSEVDFDDGGETGTWRICSVHELAGDRIARITQDFGPPFPVADWRDGITEPIVP